jgi:hypothetical protein
MHRDPFASMGLLQSSMHELVRCLFHVDLLDLSLIQVLRYGIVDQVIDTSSLAIGINLQRLEQIILQDNTSYHRLRTLRSPDPTLRV